MKKTTAKAPRLKLTAEDHARLTGLAAAAMDRIPETAERLADALDRAQVVTGRRPAGAAGMGSHVEFRDEATGKTQAVVLVYPGEADIERGRVSVLTPVGAALVGVAEGACVECPTRGGAARRLTVVAVREHEPEPA